MTIDPMRLPRPILKWVLRVLLFCLALIILVLASFRTWAHFRETKNIGDEHSSTGQLIQAGDAQLFVQFSGPQNGQPVVLIHGTGAWSELWRDTIDPLAASGFRVIALDLPPFGYSQKLEGAQSYSRAAQARRINALLRALNISHALFVCHSVGCRPAIEAALNQPDNFKSLVLVDPALGFSADQQSPHFEQNNPSWPLKFAFSLKAVRNAGIATYGTNPRSIKSLFSSFVSNKESVTERRVKVLQQPLNLKNMTSAQGDWLEYLMISSDNSGSSKFENFKKLNQPKLIIWGSADTITPLWQGQKLQQLMPDSELVVVSGSGHIPYIESTPEFNKILIDFLIAKAR